MCNRVFFLLKKYHLHVDCLQHHPMGDQMELIMYLENNVFAMCVYACRKQQEHSNMFTGKVKHIKHCCNDEYIFSVMMRNNILTLVRIIQEMEDKSTTDQR